MTEDVTKGIEQRDIEKYGDGEVFDWFTGERRYLVAASRASGTDNCTYGGRPYTLEEAIAHRDRLMADHPDDVARYEVWEIVELTHFVRHRVVDTQVKGAGEMTEPRPATRTWCSTCRYMGRSRCPRHQWWETAYEPGNGAPSPGMAEYLARFYPDEYPPKQDT